MKKVVYLMLISLVVVVLAACNGENTGEEPQSTLEPEPYTKVHVKGVGKVDVINTHGSIDGFDNMERFYNSVQHKIPADLRIVHYTIEGDPIITDANYDGELLEITYDTTRDNFGYGTVTTKKCSKFIKEENPTNTSYVALDCDDEYGMMELLYISHDLNLQDVFEFELKYGLTLENEINTRTNTVKIEQKYGALNIPPEVKQEVLKRLVFANYLAEKELDASCNRKGTPNYEFIVYINQAELEFQWNACDESADGVKFTDIANYIIEQSTKERVQRDVTVQGYVLEIRDNEMLIGQGLTILDYEWVKGELQHINFEHYHFDFTILEGVETKAFKRGDKIRAALEGNVVGANPGRAKVKEIRKIEL